MINHLAAVSLTINRLRKKKKNSAKLSDKVHAAVYY